MGNHYTGEKHVLFPIIAMLSNVKVRTAEIPATGYLVKTAVHCT